MNKTQSNNLSPIQPGMEGCQKCGRDDDHSNLLVCEGCNDEYHIYCLDPPLSSVPDGDFFCDKCKLLHRIKQQSSNDSLLQLVSCLPPDYTCRFGEVVWASGGNGFGWWPSVIYDPRLTVDSARKLALKHLGKKHIVYFYGCKDAPFTVLDDAKLLNWNQGLLEGFDAGKTAESRGKNRYRMFQHAMQVATVENDKPIHARLSWNNEDELDGMIESSTTSTSVSRKPSPSQQAKTLANKVSPYQSKKRGRVPTRQGDLESTPSQRKQRRTKQRQQNSPQPEEESELSSSPNKIDQEMAEEMKFFCKLFLIEQIEDQSNEKVDDKRKNIGFITLSCKTTCTFADARIVMELELDDECLPSRGRWKFVVPNLGPVSKKQEKKLGAMLDLLTSADGDGDFGDGSTTNPLQLTIVPSSAL